MQPYFLYRLFTGVCIVFVCFCFWFSNVSVFSSNISVLLLFAILDSLLFICYMYIIHVMNTNKGVLFITKSIARARCNTVNECDGCVFSIFLISYCYWIFYCFRITVLCLMFSVCGVRILLFVLKLSNYFYKIKNVEIVEKSQIEFDRIYWKATCPLNVPLHTKSCKYFNCIW